MEQYGETKKRRKMEAGDQPKEKKSQEETVQICSLFFKKNWSLTKKD